jgi:L-amino acid N-acyltransferase YncA
MEIRTATLADLDAVLAVHTAARTAYYLAGGLAEAELTDPAEHARRRAGWAIEASDRTVLCAVRADGTVVGVPVDGRTHRPRAVPDPRHAGGLEHRHRIPPA